MIVNSPSTSEASHVADQTRWFTEEVQPHDSSLKAYLRSSFPHVRDVDDVVQESYLRIWKVRTKQTVNSARAFLFTVVRHVALDKVRHDRASPIDSMADLADSSAVEDSLSTIALIDQQEKIRLLGKALALLSERTREIVVLRKFEGISQKEVARRLGLSEAAVEHQVSRGLSRCEAYLRKCGIWSMYDDGRR